jgi:hypothetical protein
LWGMRSPTMSAKNSKQQGKSSAFTLYAERVSWREK